MDFELTPQQSAFRDLMRDFAKRSIAPVARDWELGGRYPTEIIEEMKGMGLFGMLVSEEYGRIEVDAVSYAVVFEEIAKAWMGMLGSWARTRSRRGCWRSTAQKSSAANGCQTSAPARNAQGSP